MHYMYGAADEKFVKPKWRPRQKSVQLHKYKYEETEYLRMRPKYDKNEISIEFLRSPDTLQSLSARVVDKLPMEDFYNWTNIDVRRWILKLGYPIYRETFRVNDIRGRKLLLLDVSGLQAMNIKDFEHMKDIAHHIRRLFFVEWAKFGRNLALPPQDFFELYKLWHTRTRGIDYIRRTDLWRKMQILRLPPKQHTHWDKLERWVRGESDLYEPELWGYLRRYMLYACEKAEPPPQLPVEIPPCTCMPPCDCFWDEDCLRLPWTLSCLVETGMRKPMDPEFILECPKCIPPCDCKWTVKKYTSGATLSCLQYAFPHKYGYPHFKNPYMGMEPLFTESRQTEQYKSSSQFLRPLLSTTYI